MSYTINNNALEVDPSPRKKRKRSLQCTNVYTNPALDILSTEDTMCNNIMEVAAPTKRTRRSHSCDSRVSFENPGMDLHKKQYDGLLRKELSNVNEKLSSITEVASPAYQNMYQNNDSFNMVVEEKSILHVKANDSIRQINSTPVLNSNAVVKRRASFDLSFIEKLGIDDSINGEALYLDDDLNESNIMEIKTFTILTNKKVANRTKKIIPKNTNPFLNCEVDYDSIPEATVEPPISNFPFDIPVQNSASPQDGSIATTSSFEVCDMSEPEIESITSIDGIVVPRRLFVEDDSSIQYMDEQSIMNNNKKFGHSTLNDPINYNFATASCRSKPVFVFEGMNKQSKILGCDVTNISQNEIFNCQKDAVNVKKVNVPNINNNIEVTFKDNSSRLENFKKQSSKSNSKISSKIFNKIKDVFRHDKKQPQKNETMNGNPYEVVRKAPVQEKSKKPPPVCFVNPALNLNSDMECDETDCKNVTKLYSTTSSFNSRNPFEITPMKRARENMLIDKENTYTSQSSMLSNCVDLSDISCQTENIGKKHVRFDSTLNHEKVITGNSFDSDHNSGNSSSSSNSNQVTQVLHHIDYEIEEYHNELENCFNEKKFISQNL